MQDHVLDRRQRQCRMTLEPDGPVSDEAGSVAVVAGEVVPVRRFTQPEAVVPGGAGATDPGIVPDCGYELGTASGKDKYAPPQLAHAGVREPGNVRSGKAGSQELAGPGDAAHPAEVVEEVHQASTGA